MRTRSCLWVVSFLAPFAIVSCGEKVGKESGVTSAKTSKIIPPVETHPVVDADAIINANASPGEWLSHGRTYSEQRHSPLDEISTANVGELGLAWSFDLGTSRGIEATPIVRDGIIYVTGSWNIVHARDAKTGAEIWSFDPEVDRTRASIMCCDIVNRGVAIWGKKVFTGTIDGRLIAIDAKTGEKAWDINTTDNSKPYSITGAPRIVKGKVIIGNGGAELGVRGYVTAYDVDTGEQAWRFYTVPGNPADGFEDSAMEMAAETWNGEWWNVGGGGGTVWDSMAYDPELDLLYIGVGNGSPWNYQIRSNGEGDNLFLSSIVALRPDTGEYVWHYQTTPGETWDYTATQHMILADMEIEGATRKVIMQAPKNGFFYVLDRETGEFISANNFVPVNWATHIDPATGRPVEVAAARYPGKTPHLQMPAPLGAHNWHPMAYNPNTGLVYIPAQEGLWIYGEVEDFEYKEGAWNTGTNFMYATLPDDDAKFKALVAAAKGQLIAWDPVTQSAKWAVDYPDPSNGGVLSTDGGIVFQGTAGAEFVAYDAASGERLWGYPTQTGVVAAPVTYEIDGEQYVAVAVGWGGAYVLAYGGPLPTNSAAKVGRLLVFKLGGDAELPALDVAAAEPPPPPASTASAETIAAGFEAYANFCISCHGDEVMSSGLVPNLRHSALLHDIDAWNMVVREGALAQNGMASFRELVDEETSAAIREYVIAKANSDRDAEFYQRIQEETSGGE
ncbi:MAG: PQQ-dependent dehydrogenase, methanol/ethanol family [Marinicaulis sp.]|nr:PQQ-dependent dehydrogenase, methanol/ethanol family [Marinicaulis sp.]